MKNLLMWSIRIILVSGGIGLIVTMVYIDSEFGYNESELKAKTKETSINDMLKENNKEASYDGMIASPVEKDKYYRNKFYDAEKKIKDNKNIDKDIKDIESKISGEEKENHHFKNKKNILSGYKSALVSLNELNENNKKGNKENNDMLIDNINEQLGYSQRELMK